MKSWWRTSLLTALLAMVVVGLALWLPLGKATIVLACGVLVYIIMLARNPRYWYRRTAAAVLGIWLVSGAATGFEFAFQWGDELFGYFVTNRFSGPFHFTIAAAFITLVLLDYWRTCEDIRQAGSESRKAIESTDNADIVLDALQTPEATERERLIKSVGEGERFYLALTALQVDRVSFPVDTSKLSREQKLKVVFEQIRLREIELFEMRRRWTVCAIVVVVAIIVSGAVAAKALQSVSATGQIEDPLRIVDLSFEESAEGQRTIDVKFRNVGDEPIFLKRADIHIERFTRLDWRSQFSHQMVTWTGNVSLPRPEPVTMSQSLAPKATDRIQIEFTSTGRNVFFEVLYDMWITFIYNETDESAQTEQFTIFIPRQATVTGVAKNAEKEKAAIQSHVEVFKDYQSTATLKDPKFLQVVKEYEEAGHF